MRHLFNRLYKDHIGKKAKTMSVGFTKQNEVVSIDQDEPVSARNNYGTNSDPRSFASSSKKED